MITSVFWNTSHKLLNERPGDPLGFDALREAMSDCLAPHLTGGTRHADDYLWALVGLHWARGNAGAKVDADVWEEFRKFERALKQYWQRFTKRRDYSGFNTVKKLCGQDRDRPNVNQPILRDERANGLLGTYIASLRAIGLAGKTAETGAESRASSRQSALSLTKVGDQLIQGVGFTASARTFTSWSALCDGFSTTEREICARRKALGNHLFRDDHMRRAANAMLACPAAHSWSGLAAHLRAEQRRVANACAAVLDVENAMVKAFEGLITGLTSLTDRQCKSVKNTSIRVRKQKPMPNAWLERPIATAIDSAWSACTNGHGIEQHLIDLHVKVAHIRGNEPWITALGEESLIEFQPGSAGHDFRLENLRRLVKETKWNPDAIRT